MPLYVVCTPAPDGTTSVAPCADVGGIPHAPTVTEIGAPEPVTFDNANTLFAYGFAAVIMFWAIGMGVGAILGLINRES